ncbi:MAG TPA: hypothetical protein VMM77_00565 [Gemmatimonadaceae bacterium]|nr:hypothetical protein [Gemmatimonadaceae bacterium]
MKRSVERILTTHTGSLPRPAWLLERLRKRTGAGDEADFSREVSRAIAESVEKQLEAGIDVVSDGEQGKPDYSTYIKDRLTGFGGEPVRLGPTRDQLDFPDYAQALPGLAGGRPSGPACIGPIAWRNFDAVERDIASLKAALARNAGAAEGFVSAVSPRQAARFMPNRYYGSDEEYLQVLSDALRKEYEAIVAAGFVLQLDCPDLASSWNNQYRHLRCRSSARRSRGMWKCSTRR